MVVSAFAVDIHSSVPIPDLDPECELKIKEELKQEMDKIIEDERSSFRAVHKRMNNGLYMGSFLSAGYGLVSAHLLYRKLVKPAILRSAKTRFIFTGVEVPFALSVIKAILSPLAILAFGGYGYYKIKEYFIQPLELKHEEQLNKSRQLFLKEKAELAEQNKKFMEKMQREVLQLRTNTVTTQQIVHDELGKIKGENTLLRKGIERMVAMAQEENATANDALRQQLIEAYETYKKQLLEFTHNTVQHLGKVQENVKDLKSSNEQLQGAVSTAQSKVEDLFNTINQLAGQTGREARMARAFGNAVKDLKDKQEKLEEELKKKKDKRESTGFFK